MPSQREVSRSSAIARTDVLVQLKEDHKRVKKAYREFQKLDVEEDAEACQALVEQVLQELTVHATLEEELLYPAARRAVTDESVVDEAEVEHESMHALIDQLMDMDPEDPKYFARFKVLCEYTLHHVKEEEGELFPELERVRMDWSSLAAEMAERREELSPADGMEGSPEQNTEGELSGTESEPEPAAQRGRDAQAEDQPVKPTRSKR